MISRPRSLKPLRIYKLTVGGVIPRQWRHSLELPPLLQGVDIQRFASGHRTNRWRYARIETSEYGIQYHPQFRTKVRREHKNIQTPCVFCSQFWIFSGLLGTKMLFFSVELLRSNTPLTLSVIQRSVFVFSIQWISHDVVLLVKFKIGLVTAIFTTSVFS